MLEFCRSVYRLIWHWSNLTDLYNAKKLEQCLMKLQKPAELLSKNSNNCRLSWISAFVLVMISKIRTFCARYFMGFEGKLLVMQKDVCRCPKPKHIHIQNSKYKSVLVVIIVFLTKNWLLSNTRFILCWNSIVGFKNCHYFPPIP